MLISSALVPVAVEYAELMVDSDPPPSSVSIMLGSVILTAPSLVEGLTMIKSPSLRLTYAPISIVFVDPSPINVGI